MMQKLYFVLLMVMLLSSCGATDQDYAEQKEHEREVISSFINRNVVMTYQGDTLLNLGKIKVITEEQFELQDSTTDVSKNEFVLFSSTGIYLQIVRKGTGKRIESGENRRLLCRFWEYNIQGDSLQLTNRLPVYALMPEYLDVSNKYGVFSGSFDTSVKTGSMMYSMYSDTQVPEGWLKPLEFVRVGPQTGEERIAKVRVIVPHGSGQQHAIANVYPCFYELTFQEL